VTPGFAATLAGAALSASLAAASPLARASPRDVERTVDAAAAAALERGIPGLTVAVLRGDEVLLARGYGVADRERGVGASAATVYAIGSISKQFTAAAILRLAERGTLALDDPVERHLPGYRPAGGTVRLHHLLRQTSGIREFFTLPAFNEGNADLDRPTSELVAMIEREPLGFAPGTRWSYSNSNYTLLAQILERRTGQPYERFLDQEFFRPLGLAATHHCAPLPAAPHHARGYGRAAAGVAPVPPENMNWARGDGGLCSTVEDLARWARALATGRAVSQRSYRLMTSRERLPDGTSPDYGYGLSLVSLDGRARKVAHNGAIGGFTSTLAHYPDHDLTIAVLTNLADARSESIEKAIARELLGSPVPGRPVAALLPDERREFAGAYDVGVFSVSVAERDGGLWLEMPRPGPTSALAYEGGGTFGAEIDPDAIRLSFVERPGPRRRLVLLMSGMHWYGTRGGVTGGRQDQPTPFSSDDLRRVPRATDPWSVLRDVPGVVVDRVNVGGSDTALQSLVLAHGDAGAGTVWSLDGFDVTDPAALGATAVFPDMDALDGAQVLTAALDVRVRTPGVQVALSLRPPSPRLSAAAHLRGSTEGLQSDNRPEELRDRPFLRNRTESLLEAGAEAGGPVGGRWWLWGAAAHSALRQETLTEHEEELRLTSLIAKARARLGQGATSLLALRSEKVHEDRDTGFSAAPEARWTQSGPAWLVALEDRRGAGRVSLLSRAAYLDAGFTLTAPGGDADVLEDFRGVTRGSYAMLRTERERLQLGLEGTTAARGLGFDHDLLAGAGYRRSSVGTDQWWPGSGVRALERRDVFFRTFQLTGFALPTRAQQARSVHDHAELYVQDAARRGRLGVVLGLRLDRQAGHNQPSRVEASGLVPHLLPAVAYPGAEKGIRWLDVLPRAGLSWDFHGDGRWVARAGYAEQGAMLGASDVTFENPIGREPASVTFYWLDRNGDHAVQASELDRLRGQLGTSGLDPTAPGSTVSPHTVDPDLRSPHTRQALASVEHVHGPGRWRTALSASWARTVHPLWRPLRNLTVADYTIRGAVTGTLFGEPYSVGYYAPATESRIVPGHGRVLSNREGYRQDALTVELTTGGRTGPLAWNAWAAYMDWREFFTDTDLSLQDPTPLDTEPLQDAGMLAARPGGLGRGDVFVNARWMAGGTLEAALPWRLRAVAHLYARDGFPIPYFQVASTGDPTAGSKNVLISPHFDTYRLPPLALLDLRLARELTVGRHHATVIVDVFNALNQATTLQVARDIELPAFDRPREIVRPRMVRLGLEYRF
jgi:CubicO group peptidase (beta-lactamase class C family)